MVPAPHAALSESPETLNVSGHNLPKIRQAGEPEPSIINEKTVADFTRVVEQTGILDRQPRAPEEDACWAASDISPSQRRPWRYPASTGSARRSSREPRSPW
jgi:hypothetical protein